MIFKPNDSLIVFMLGFNKAYVLQEFLSLTKRPKQKDPSSKPLVNKSSAASDSDLDSSEGSDDEVSIYPYRSSQINFNEWNDWLYGYKRIRAPQCFTIHLLL